MRSMILAVLLMGSQALAGIQWDQSRFNGLSPQEFLEQGPPDSPVHVELVIVFDHSPRIGFYDTTLKVSSADGNLNRYWTPQFGCNNGFAIVDRGTGMHVIDYGTQGFDIDVEAVVYEWEYGDFPREFYRFDSFTIPYEQDRTVTIDAIAGNWFGRVAIPGPADDLPYMEFTFAPPATACLIEPMSDANGDCVVNLQDLSLLAAEWMICGLYDSQFCPA